MLPVRYSGQFPAGFQFQDNFLEASHFQHFPDTILLGKKRNGRENDTYYKSNHESSAAIEKPSLKRNSMIASKYGKIYVLLRLLVKYWMRYHDIFYCLVHYLIYHMSFLSAHYLFTDYNVRNVTRGKKSSTVNNDYIFLKCYQHQLFVEW